MLSVFLPRGLARQLLLVLALVALIAVAGLGLAAYHAERQALEERVADELATLTLLKSEQLDAWLAERQADVQLLAVNRLNQEHFTELFSPDVPSSRKKEFAAFLADNLVGLQRSRDGYREVSMVDATGTVIISTDSGAVGRPVISQEAFAAALAAPDGRAIQDIHRDPVTGQPTMAFAHVIRAIDLETGQETDQVIGVLVTVVDMEATVFPLLGPLAELGGTAETFLVRQEGDAVVYLSDLLFYPDAALDLTIPLAGTRDEAARRAASGQSGELLRTTDYRGEPVLAVYRHIKGIGWGFVAKQDLEQALAPVRALEIRLALLALTVLAAMGVLAFFLARTLTRPIEALATAAQAIAAGDLSVKLRSDRQDELGELARAFQRMVAALAQRQRRAAITTDVLRTLNGTPHIPDAFQAIAAGLRSTIGYESIGLAIWNKTRGRFEMVAVDPPQSILPAGAIFDQSTSAATADVLEGRPHLTPDLAQEMDHPLDRLLHDQGCRSRISLPLLNQDRVVGMLSIGWRRPAGWKEEDLPLLTQFASTLALALERSQLFDEVRRRAEELERAYLELHQADQLKDAFIRNITHELRTPVATLSGYTELLLEDDVSNLREDQEEMLQVVADQTQRLVRLVNDVVSLHSVDSEADAPRPLRLVDVAQASLEQAQQRAGGPSGDSRHSFVLDAPDPDVWVLGERSQVSRVLDNLLDNAVKFSPEGGLVRVRVAQEIRDDKAWAVVAVQDQGIGIAEEDLAAIWERFLQLDSAATRRYGGAGLGLAVVKETVQAHGGWVCAESQPGQGTTIYAAFPLLTQEISSPHMESISTNGWRPVAG